MAALVFVGRERELATLQTFWERAATGQGQVVFVSGEAGIGKTALLQEFARRVQASPVPPVIAIGNCNAYTGLGDPYLPFREILALLTGDVETKLAQGMITPENAQRLRTLFVRSIQVLVEVTPDLVNVFIPGSALLGKLAKTVLEKAGWLGKLEKLVQRKQPQPQKGEFALEQSRLFEQYTTFLCQLAQEQPLVLVLDDLQWADDASISLLFHLGRRITAARILLIGAYRSDEVALGRSGERHPLDKVLVEFKRYFGDIELDLRQTMAAEGLHFVDALLDSQPNRLGVEFRRALFEQTEGHPLFTVELLQAMKERGELRQDEAESWVAGPALDWQTLPVRIEGVIEERIARLAEDLRQLLAVASVEGEDFTAQVIARVQAVSEQQVLRALSQELEKRQHLVHEQGEVQVGRQYLSRYRFVHGLFQHYLYHELGAGERRLLHGEVGAALEEFYQGQTDDISVQLAYHYEEAGEAAKAVPYLLHAGDRARRLYAHQEAIDYYQRTLHRLDTLARHRGQKQDSHLLAPVESGVDNAARFEALKGLGLAYLGSGQADEAEDYFRQAIALGKELHLAPQELVRTYYWLGEVLWWLNRYDERIQVGEEGLALLGDDSKSAEAALMNSTIAWSYYFKGNPQKSAEFTLHNVPFIEYVPYSQELGFAYLNIVLVYADFMINMEEAMRWANIWERQAQQHHDLRSLASLYTHMGWVLRPIVGDLKGSVSYLEKGLELFTQIGFTSEVGTCLFFLGRGPLLELGALSSAEDCIRRALVILTEVGHTQFIAESYVYLGIVYLCQQLPQKAIEAFHLALQFKIMIGTIWAHASLGQAYLAVGNQTNAIYHFQETLAQSRPQDYNWWQPPFVVALAGLEDAYDDFSRFRDYCLHFQKEHSIYQPGMSVLTTKGELIANTFIQWYLEPAQIDNRYIVNDFGMQVYILDDAQLLTQTAGWTWYDPFDDSFFTTQRGNGLTIRAANGRDLLYANLSAPRLLRTVRGDCAAETICRPAAVDKPAIGGLLLWQDKENYLRLERGTWGKDELTFSGSLNNHHTLIGRGRLVCERVHLRLERVGDRVRALCSADGQDWWIVGWVDFAVSDPVQVGLHAIGAIDRRGHQGAYPDGTAIRFESFVLYSLLQTSTAESEPS